MKGTKLKTTLSLLFTRSIILQYLFKTLASLFVLMPLKIKELEHIKREQARRGLKLFCIFRHLTLLMHTIGAFAVMTTSSSRLSLGISHIVSQSSFRLYALLS